MGLFEMLNKASGYSEENMMKAFDSALGKMGATALYPIAVSFKRKVTLLQSKVYATGYAAITSTNGLLVYTVTPVKGAGLYDYISSKNLKIKNAVAGQKIIEGNFLNVSAMEFDELILQVSPNVGAFPNQASNLEQFLSVLEQYKTE